MCITTLIAYKDCIVEVKQYVICADHIAHTRMQIDNEPCPKAECAYRPDVKNSCHCKRYSGTASITCMGDGLFEKGRHYRFEITANRDEIAKIVQREREAEKARIVAEQNELDLNQERRERVDLFNKANEKKRRRIEEARVVKTEPGSDEVQDWKSNFDNVHRAIDDFKMEDDADMANSDGGIASSAHGRSNFQSSGDQEEDHVYVNPRVRYRSSSSQWSTNADPGVDGPLRFKKEDDDNNSVGIGSSRRQWSTAANPGYVARGVKREYDPDDIFDDTKSGYANKRPYTAKYGGGFNDTGLVKEEDLSDDGTGPFRYGPHHPKSAYPQTPTFDTQPFAKITNSLDDYLNNPSPPRSGPIDTGGFESLARQPPRLKAGRFGDWDTQPFVNGENSRGSYLKQTHENTRRASAETFDPKWTPKAKKRVSSGPPLGAGGIFGLAKAPFRRSAGLEPDPARLAAIKDEVDALPDYEDSEHGDDVVMK